MSAYFLPFPAADTQKLRNLLLEKPKILITTHSRPDGDAMGSSLALQQILRLNGLESEIIIPDPVDDYLSWLPGAHNCTVANSPAIPGLIQNADLIFCLDYGSLSRTGEVISTHLRKSKAKRILVDHHIDPENEYEIQFHTVQSSSTCELIFRLIWDLGWAEKIDLSIAQCLYTGMVTDTGSFRFDATSANLHNVVAFLFSKGLKPAEIHIQLFDNSTENRLRFLGYCLENKMKVLYDLKTAYMTVTREEMNRFQVTDGDTEGLVNYNLSIKGINLAVLIIERPDKVKLSFRSKGKFACNVLAGNFEGGGHHNASGGQSNLSLNETESKLINLLTQSRNELSY